jgi:ATP-binding protein involved in chromosome partitioning
MRSALQAKVRLLGVIENMSGYACGACGHTGALFPGQAGAELAQRFAIPLVAKIPFHPTPFPPAELATLSDAVAAVLP